MPERTHNSLMIIACLAVAMLAGCLERNPVWIGNKKTSDGAPSHDLFGGNDSTLPPSDGGPGDQGPGKDGPKIPPDGPKIPPDIKPPPDVKPWPDVVPWPDSKPWVCTKDSDCDDKLSCTTDKCVAGKCQSTIQSGTCKIGTTCYKKDDANPQNSCQVCDPGIFPKQWSPLADGVGCAKDGLGCTTDICNKGQCTHPIISGCVISGKCIPEGEASAKDACKACVSKLNTKAYSSADGLPCSPGSNKPGLCVANKCRGFNEGTWGVSSASSTSLGAVARIPKAKGVWATGRYRAKPNDPEMGVLVEVSALAAGKAPATKLTASPLNDLHGDLAVGDKGQALRYNNGVWAADQPIVKALGGDDRRAVFTGGTSAFLVGPPGQTAHAMMRCGPSSAGITSCSNQTGVSQGRTLGGIFGTLAPTGQGPLWAVVVGSNQPEDIYYNPGNTTSWSTNGPTGCRDSGNNPCSNTPWTTYAIGGDGVDDVWVVGTDAGILRYDGKAWKKVTNVIPSGSNIDLLSVFSSKKDNLVTVVGVRNDWGNTGHKVQLYNYNRKLDAWLGPVVLYQGPRNTPVYMLDMGGADYSDAWLVGQKEVTSSGVKVLSGWVMKLQ